MKKRKPSEQTLFERWYSKEFALTLPEIRAWRNIHGYGWESIDAAWAGWQGRAKVKT